MPHKILLVDDEPFGTVTQAASVYQNVLHGILGE